MVIYYFLGPEVKIMVKSYPVFHCSEKDRQLIDERAKSRAMEARLVERAKIIQRCFRGEPIKKMA